VSSDENLEVGDGDRLTLEVYVHALATGTPVEVRVITTSRPGDPWTELCCFSVFPDALTIHEIRGCLGHVRFEPTPKHLAECVRIRAIARKGS